MSTSSKRSSTLQDHEIEDDETCKPLNTSNIERSDIKAGRRFLVPPKRAIDILKDNDDLESSATLRESLHIATLNDV